MIYRQTNLREWVGRKQNGAGRVGMDSNCAGIGADRTKNEILSQCGSLVYTKEPNTVRQKWQKCPERLSQKYLGTTIIKFYYYVTIQNSEVINNINRINAQI